LLIRIAKTKRLFVGLLLVGLVGLFYDAMRFREKCGIERVDGSRLRLAGRRSFAGSASERAVRA
jgi:hypothetical protein